MSDQSDESDATCACGCRYSKHTVQRGQCVRHGCDAPRPATENGGTPSWTLASLNTGVCPGCREVKFIGHGPYCSDCFHATSPETGDA